MAYHSTVLQVQVHLKQINRLADVNSDNQDIYSEIATLVQLINSQKLKEYNFKYKIRDNDKIMKYN